MKLYTNIIKMDLDILSRAIDEYTSNHTNFMQEDLIMVYNRPTLLMSEQTISLMEQALSLAYPAWISPLGTSPYWSFLGCKIAIANWLPLGEVQLA